MSTTFEVYPVNSTLPTFGRVLEKANVYLKNFLESIGVFADVKIILEIRECLTHKLVAFNHEDYAKWEENQYAWFMISETIGGSDAYFQIVDELDIEVWNEELKTNSNAQRISNSIHQSLGLRYYWRLRRSMGQPPIVNLAYGLIAASIASLTEGFIFTDDSAWEYKKFPCTAEEFLEFYFRPHLTMDENDIRWSSQCINAIKQLYGKQR